MDCLKAKLSLPQYLISIFNNSFAMRKLKTILLGFSLFFLPNVALIAQWQAVEYPTEKGVISNVDLVDPSTIYAVFSNNNTFSIEKSTDAGNSWLAIEPPVDLMPFEFQSIHFYENEKGVVVIRDLSNDIQPTKLYHTNDDGQSWTEIGPSETATGIGNAVVQFLNEEIGFLSTDLFLYKTLDGGQTWATHEIPGYIISLDFLDQNNGTIGLFDGTFNYFGGMFCTNNGGESWEGTFQNELNTVVGNVQQVDENKAYAAPSLWGTYNLSHPIFFTENAGTSWDTISLPELNSNMKLLHLHLDNNGQIQIISADDNMLHAYTMDENHTAWTLEKSFDNVQFIDADFAANAALLSGNEGLFYIKNLINAAAEPASNQVELYPNPTKPGDILLLRGLNDNYHLELFDINGQLILQQKDFTSESFKLPELPSGLYMLSFSKANSKITKRIIVK